MNSPREVGLVPVKQPPQQGNFCCSDVAHVREGTMPGEYDRYNMKRLVSLTANIEGEDLGRVAGRRRRGRCQRPGEPPRGVPVEVRGQIAPMQQMFRGLAIGLRRWPWW